MTAREIPMLFSRPMVLALLAGRKTQTRRMIFPGKPGDLVWVKETWRTYTSLDNTKPVDIWTPDEERGAAIFFEAGGSQFISRGPAPRLWSQDDESVHPGRGKVRTSIHMPKWASRITLRIEDVRQEPLRSISEADAIAEGIEPETVPISGVPGWRMYDGTDSISLDPRWSYESLWNSIHGDRTFELNPTVFVVTFETCRENVIARRSGGDA